MFKQIISTLAIIFALVACSVDSYDTGDGSYSYLKAEMVNMHTIAGNKVDYGITDNDVRLTFSPPYNCSWANTADSTYRAMLYYNETQQGIKPIAAKKVLVLQPVVSAKPVTTNPVKLESVWISDNKQYLNMRIGLLTGASNDVEAKHYIGVVLKTDELNQAGKRIVSLQFSHARNQMPEYYTNTLYLSVPISAYHEADSIQLSVNTYNGIVVRSFALSPQ